MCCRCWGFNFDFLMQIINAQHAARSPHVHVYPAKYTNGHSRVFIWMHNCQHTQVSVFIWGCLLPLWMFDTLPWTWPVIVYLFIYLFFAIFFFAVTPGGSAERLCDLCDRLHGTLAEADMLGRHCKRRSGILRTLFRLIDHNSARLNLLIAKLCLAVSHLRVCVCVSARLPLSL